jgi:hypothetical protein
VDVLVLFNNTESENVVQFKGNTLWSNLGDKSLVKNHGNSKNKSMYDHNCITAKEIQFNGNHRATHQQTWASF